MNIYSQNTVFEIIHAQIPLSSQKNPNFRRRPLHLRFTEMERLGASAPLCFEGTIFSRKFADFAF